MKILYKSVFVIFFSVISYSFSYSQQQNTFLEFVSYKSGNYIYSFNPIQKPNGNYLILSNVQYGGPPIDYYFSEIDKYGKQTRDFHFDIDYYQNQGSKFIYFNNGDIYFEGVGSSKVNGRVTYFTYLFDKHGNTKWTTGHEFYIEDALFTKDSNFVGFGVEYNKINDEYFRYLTKVDYNEFNR